MGILSQHAPILTASVKLEKGVLSLAIILILVLVTALLSKDVNKGVMSRFPLPKYSCIHFLHLLHTHVVDMNIRSPHLFQLYCHRPPLTTGSVSTCPLVWGMREGHATV